MENWFFRYLKMVETLKNHPDITVFADYLSTPYKEHEFLEIEQRLGYQLPKNIKAFYQQSDGILLKWIHNNHLDYDESKYFEQCEGHGHFWDDRDNLGLTFHACINILSLEETLFGWEDNDDLILHFNANKEIFFNGKEYTGDQFRAILKPFDLLTHDKSVAFIFEQETCLVNYSNESDVSFCDHDSNRNVSTFEAYLEFLLTSWGLVEERNQYFHTEQYNPQEIKTLKKPKPFSKKKYLSPYPNTYKISLESVDWTSKQKAIDQLINSNLD